MTTTSERRVPFDEAVQRGFDHIVKQVNEQNAAVQARLDKAEAQIQYLHKNQQIVELMHARQTEIRVDFLTRCLADAGLLDKGLLHDLLASWPPDYEAEAQRLLDEALAKGEAKR